MFSQTEQQIYVDRAQKKTGRKIALKKDFIENKKMLQEQNKDKNIYIKNLDPDVNDQGLNHAFQRFGEITSAKVYFIIIYLKLFTLDYFALSQISTLIFKEGIHILEKYNIYSVYAISIVCSLKRFTPH